MFRKDVGDEKKGIKQASADWASVGGVVRRSEAKASWTWDIELIVPALEPGAWLVIQPERTGAGG